jgi:hypothetical protein
VMFGCEIGLTDPLLAEVARGVGRLDRERAIAVRCPRQRRGCGRAAVEAGQRLRRDAIAERGSEVDASSRGERADGCDDSG